MNLIECGQARLGISKVKPNSELALSQEYVKLWSWFFLSGSAFREVTQIYSIISSECGQVCRD